MRSLCLGLLASSLLLLASVPVARGTGCGFTMEKVTRVTNAAGHSQTARGNARCICVDPEGTAHLVWTDDRFNNVEIYYTTLRDGKLSREVRLTDSPGESTFPCIACRGADVYVIWQEKVGKVFQIYYVHLRGEKELARKQLTSSLLDAGCPVSAIGPDGTLHLAWHEGPSNMTAVYYAKVVNDSLVGRTAICNQHSDAFRPDIAVDDQGRVLVVWFEGLYIKSKLWDGKAWGDETLAATNSNREWRMSVTNMPGGKWALAWYDQRAAGTDVLAKLYDGKTWSAETRLNRNQNSFYATIANLGDGKLLVAWEDRDKQDDKYLLAASCFDGHAWSEPMYLVRDDAMSRYCSLAPYQDSVNAIWFSVKPGNDEIFHGLLRRK